MTDEIVIRFTAAQLDIVANALGHRPYIEAAPVLDVLRQQVAQQQAQPLPPPGANDGGNAPALQ